MYIDSECSLKISGKYRFNIFNKESRIRNIVESPNLIVARGKEMVARILMEDVPTGMFQYFALGDNNTAPSSGDTVLNSEVGRVAIQTQSFFANTVTLTGTIPADEIVGFTLQEIGIFGIDGSPTLNSGQLFSRALISPTIVKTNVLVVNISYVLTIS